VSKKGRKLTRSDAINKGNRNKDGEGGGGEGGGRECGDDEV